MTIITIMKTVQLFILIRIDKSTKSFKDVHSYITSLIRDLNEMIMFNEKIILLQTVREFLPAMIDRNDGYIVALSSMAGRGGVAYLTDYV